MIKELRETYRVEWAATRNKAIKLIQSAFQNQMIP
jgi:hypothetical protein